MDKSGDQQNYYPSPVTASEGQPSGTQGFPPHAGRPNEPRGLAHPFRLSPEENRVLKECGRESMLFRSIPYATIASALAYYGLTKGYLKPSPTYGYFPKVTLAAIIGYSIGKVTYQKHCAEKIMQLPNSKLADAIRKSRRGLAPSSDADADLGAGGSAHEVFTSIPAKPIFDDHKPDERDRNEALDDYDRVTESLSEYAVPSASSAEMPYTSYEDRRRLNREEYAAKIMQRQHTTTSSSNNRMPLHEPTVPRAEESRTRPGTSGRRNQYGDIVYDE